MTNMPSMVEMQKRLNEVTEEMLVLIRRYDLDADNPFDVIEVARRKIGDQKDYIRFLELSLEGRIYGEAAAALEKAEAEAAEASKQ
ncbi:hypothetical protein [Aestuariispira ectoiniformans]|uniref:hypothetical protein n=1 Tax=Aestuariispira ectoiniformans TaxID=2775080 RepID=UPI00223C2D5E|nr:hypothetical protein [Aestuariispira ectoiniformans]